MIAFLLVVVAIVAIGATVLAYRNRPANSIESGISSFRREMRALAPPGQRRRPAPTAGEQVAPAQPDDPTDEPDGLAPDDG